MIQQRNEQHGTRTTVDGARRHSNVPIRYRPVFLLSQRIGNMYQVHLRRLMTPEQNRSSGNTRESESRQLTKRRLSGYRRYYRGHGIVIAADLRMSR